MATKDNLRKNAEQEGTGGTKEPNQSTAEFYSMENAPTLEDFTSGSTQRDPRQEQEDEQADAREDEDSGFQGSSETKAPESSDVGESLLNPSDLQSGRLGERLDDAGLGRDFSSPNVFDDAADAGKQGGYAGMGKEGLISDGGGDAGPEVVDNNRFVWNATKGEVEEAPKMSRAEADAAAQARRDRSIWEQLWDSGEAVVDSVTTPSQVDDKQAGGQPSGNEQAGGGATGGNAGSGSGSESEKSYTRTNPDGTVDVVKGDTMFHWDPKTNEVTEKKPGEEATTTSPNDTPDLFGIPDDENESGDLPPGFIDGEALLPPEMRTESILQNMTGAGSKGGEEVNPAREGGSGQSGGTATNDGLGLKGQTTQDLIGQPDPEANPQGGKSPGSEPTFGPGQEEIDPGEEGSLPSGETRTEDLPGGTTSSEDSSLGLEGGSDEGLDFSGAAEEIEEALNPPQLPPGYEDDTTGGLHLTTTDWAEQIQDALNPPVLPLEPLDPTDDAGF